MSEESDLLRQQIAEMQAEKIARDRQIEEEGIPGNRRIEDLRVERDAERAARITAERNAEKAAAGRALTRVEEEEQQEEQQAAQQQQAARDELREVFVEFVSTPPRL
ncbi:unnamed protein product [Laminaria digitata]